MEKKNNYFTIIALLFLLATFIAGFFTKDLNTIMIIAFASSLASLIMSIVAIVYAKKIEKSKVFPIIILVVSILGTLMFGIVLAFKNLLNDPKNTAEICKTVVECKNDGEVSTCYIKEDTTKSLPVKCYTSDLTQDQFK